MSVALLAIALTDFTLLAQSRAARQPPVGSRVLQGHDGDLIVANGDDRITIVRRREGNIRLVFDAAKRSLLLLADFSSPSASTPDGVVDWVFSFTEVTGEWPLGARWDGNATIDEYWVEAGRRAVTVATPSGTVQLANPAPNDFVPLDQAHAARLTFQGRGRGREQAHRLTKRSVGQASRAALRRATR